MLFVGGRSITENRVFILQAFPPEKRDEASTMYTDLAAVYGKASSEVELLFGTYPSPEAFFAAEPTWAAQFPEKGDRSFTAGRGI